MGEPLYRQRGFLLKPQPDQAQRIGRVVHRAGQAQRIHLGQRSATPGHWPIRCAPVCYQAGDRPCAGSYSWFCARCADKSSSSMKGWINPHLPHSIFVFTGYVLLNSVGRFRQTCLQQQYVCRILLVHWIRGIQNLLFEILTPEIKGIISAMK